MRKIRKRSGQGGFSLIEVLIATAIFTVGVLAIMGLEMRVLRATAEARRLSEATRLAQYPIESFKSVSFNAVYDFLGGNNSATYTTTDTPSFPSDSAAQRIMEGWKGQFLANFEEGTGTVKVDLLQSGGEDIGAEITVYVFWKDEKGAHQVKMKQILSNAL